MTVHEHAGTQLVFGLVQGLTRQSQTAVVAIVFEGTGQTKVSLLDYVLRGARKVESEPLGHVAVLGRCRPGRKASFLPASGNAIAARMFGGSI